MDNKTKKRLTIGAGILVVCAGIAYFYFFTDVLEKIVAPKATTVTGGRTGRVEVVGGGKAEEVPGAGVVEELRRQKFGKGDGPCWFHRAGGDVFL